MDTGLDTVELGLFNRVFCIEMNMIMDLMVRHQSVGHVVSRLIDTVTNISQREGWISCLSRIRFTAHNLHPYSSSEQQGLGQA